MSAHPERTGRFDREISAARSAPERVAGTHGDRKSPPVKAAFQRDKFEHDPIVVNSITAVKTQPTIESRVIKPDPRRKIVQVAFSRALIKRADKRIDIADARVVLFVRIDLIPKAEVHRKITSDPPIVLCKNGEMRVVHIRQNEVFVRELAAKRDRKSRSLSSMRPSLLRSASAKSWTTRCGPA